MLHTQIKWFERFILTNYTKVLFFKLNAAFYSTVISIWSLRINFLYIINNPAIVIGTNYFVLWSDFHITVLFLLKGYNSSLPWRDPDGKLTDQSWSCIIAGRIFWCSMWISFLNKNFWLWLWLWDSIEICRGGKEPKFFIILWSSCLNDQWIFQIILLFKIVLRSLFYGPRPFFWFLSLSAIINVNSECDFQRRSTQAGLLHGNIFPITLVSNKLKIS